MNFLKRLIMALPTIFFFVISAYIGLGSLLQQGVHRKIAREFPSEEKSVIGLVGQSTGHFSSKSVLRLKKSGIIQVITEFDIFNGIRTQINLIGEMGEIRSSFPVRFEKYEDKKFWFLVPLPDYSKETKEVSARVKGLSLKVGLGLDRDLNIALNADRVVLGDKNGEAKGSLEGLRINFNYDHMAQDINSYQTKLEFSSMDLEWGDENKRVTESSLLMSFNKIDIGAFKKHFGRAPAAVDKVKKAGLMGLMTLPLGKVFTKDSSFRFKQTSKIDGEGGEISVKVTQDGSKKMFIQNLKATSFFSLPEKSVLQDLSTEIADHFSNKRKEEWLKAQPANDKTKADFARAQAKKFSNEAKTLIKAELGDIISRLRQKGVIHEKGPNIEIELVFNGEAIKINGQKINSLKQHVMPSPDVMMKILEMDKKYFPKS